VIINRNHLPWALFVIAVTAFCGILYVANFHPERLSHPIVLPSYFGEIPPRHGTIGGTPLGIVFGSAALSIFIFAALLNIRKRKRTWKIGHVQTWLRAHIWLTILTIPLVLFHSGFRLGAPMTTLLVVLYAVVMMSGFYGLALQQFMPRMMKERLPQEVVYEEIPHLRSLLVKQANKMRSDLAATSVTTQPTTRTRSPSSANTLAAMGTSATASGVLAAAITPQLAGGNADHSEAKLMEFLDFELLPYLRAHRSRRHRLRTQRTSDDLFAVLKLNVSEKYWPAVDDMQNWCGERRSMDLQQRLHLWLHSWLLVHAPMSFLLLILTIWHAVATLCFF
jgi:hypothetical protein